MRRDNGGCAFPFGSFQRGMTLRDWFAGQIAAASFEKIWESAREADQPAQAAVDMTAAVAYRVADAMLAAREKADTP